MMKKQTLLTSTLCLSSLFFSTLAMASQNGPYFGGSIGQGHIDGIERKIRASLGGRTLQFSANRLMISANT